MSHVQGGTQPVPRNDSLLAVALCLVASALCGFAIAQATSHPEFVTASRVSTTLLVVLTIAFLGACRKAQTVPFMGVPAGNWLTLAGVSAAFSMGLLGGDYRIEFIQQPIAEYLLLGTGCVAAGTLIATVFFRNRAVEPISGIFTSFADKRIATLGIAILVLAYVNLASGGQLPILAPDVDQARLNPTQGVFSPIFPFILGGVQWIMITAISAKILRRQAAPRYMYALAVVAGLLFFLIAVRSMLVLVAISCLMVAVSAGRVRLMQILTYALIGVVLLSIAGQLRTDSSDPTGQRNAFLYTHDYNPITGPIVQSSATGPYVFSEALTQLPNGVPFQRGTFLFRDIRQQLPLHPFGRPLASDAWVTEEVIRKDLASNGGAPPTVIGGFYIDFGLGGVVVGCLLMGSLLLLLGRWAIRASTLSALVLYGYVAAYFVLSTYSYISVRPGWLVVVALSLIAHRWEMTNRPLQNDIG